MERVGHDRIYRVADNGGVVFVGLFEATSESKQPMSDESPAPSSFTQPNGPGRLRQVESTEEIVDLGQDAAIRLHNLLQLTH